MFSPIDDNEDIKNQFNRLVLENVALRKEIKALKNSLTKFNLDNKDKDQDLKKIHQSEERLRLQSEVLAYLTTHKAIGTGDIDKAVKVLSEAASKTIKVDRVGIWLLSEDNTKLECIDLFEYSKQKHSRGLILYAENYPNYFKTLKREAIVSASNAIKDKSTSEFAEEYLIPNGISSMLDAILFDEKGIAGVVCFEHVGKPRKWTTDEEYFANIIAALFMSCRAIAERIATEDYLMQQKDEYEAQNEEYQQINEELKQTLDDLYKSNEKLEQSKQQINTILDIVDEMVWSQDYNSAVPNYISPAVKNIMGREASEFINNPKLWKEIIHPDDISFVLEALSNFQPQRHILLEYRVVHPDGNVKWVHDSTKITYDKNNKPVRLDGVVTDITARKIAEEEIKNKSNKLNTILKTMPDLLFVINKDGYYQEVFSNDPAVLMIPQEEVIGVNAVDVFGEKEGKRHIKAFRKCLKTKALQVIEYQIEEKHKTLYFEARLSPLDRENVLAIVRDITERKDYELQLSYERDILQQLMDNIPDLIFFKDSKGRYTRINEMAAKLLGVKDIKEAYGKTDYDFFDKAYAKEIFEEDKKLFKHGTPVIGKIENVAEGEKLKWILTTKVPIRNNEGKIVGLVGVSRNITELKEVQDKLKLSEEQYRLVTESAFDGIYLRNDKYFEYVNERFCKMTGYSKEELCSEDFDLSRFSFYETIHKQEESGKSKQNNAYNNLSRTYEGTITCKSGEQLKVEFSITYIKRGKRKFVLGIMRDVTERKKNEELIREIAITKKSAEFKQNFLANMSHEIRTPLTGILGMIEMIGRTELNSEQKNYLSVLKHSTDNLKEIINQVLDFSKIEAGKVSLRQKAFEFKVLINNAHGLFANLCNKDIVFESFIDPEIPEYIKADQNRISQVINNLVSNAIKFTEKGDITINANLVERKSNNQIIIKIEISDTGIGIKPEKQKHLFIPFSQIEEQDTRDYDGTGLGLSICK
ncbi:MAG: PAS domain S-box protein, partial [Bacteroidales bacterium]